MYVIIATCTANTSVSITLAWTSPYALMNFAFCTDRKQTYSLQISSKLHLFEPILAEKHCDVYINILTGLHIPWLQLYQHGHLQMHESTICALYSRNTHVQFIS